MKTSLRSRTAVMVVALATAATLAAPATAATARSATATATTTTTVTSPGDTDTNSIGGTQSTAVTPPTLPRPTGTYATGRDTFLLADHSRRDPWVPEADSRELMVSVNYPARRHGGGTPAPYMTTEEARLFLVQQDLDKVIPPAVLGATRTHARDNARPARGRFPLVMLSPGFGTPRATLTGLAEELASRGYVVATVDHAYESTGISLPDGRVLTCVACERVKEAPDLEAMKKILAAVSAGRGTDLSFVLDRLTGERRDGSHTRAWRYADMIDPHRVGTAGHSIGGSAAVSTMAGDRRVDAGINMDGAFYGRVPDSGLGGRPFMMLGTADSHSPDSADTSWKEDWARLDGWKRWLTVAGSGHFTFTDTPELTEQLGLEDPTVTISATRSTQITRGYVTAFFDRHLRDRNRPLLNGPTPANPEVVFHNP
ncbi:alpha/beta hydrolase [Streptomyces sp. NBC_01433]|uniref:alpha/beta hydrolase family protein n=1 Tax=Streptomyces sp. NBC_01433 TaxID=2903864 RepID=UPI0022592346|nr:alpha/beta hydrolase [Streptomyces sp. NBC_01433]MCX4676413.1 alpha/beta hydrolase [Streptomyces sp. NBC_01433]